MHSNFILRIVILCVILQLMNATGRNTDIPSILKIKPQKGPSDYKYYCNRYQFQFNLTEIALTNPSIELAYRENNNNMEQWIPIPIGHDGHSNFTTIFVVNLDNGTNIDLHYTVKEAGNVKKEGDFVMPWEEKWVSFGINYITFSQDCVDAYFNETTGIVVENVDALLHDFDPTVNKTYQQQHRLVAISLALMVYYQDLETISYMDMIFSKVLNVHLTSCGLTRFWAASLLNIGSLSLSNDEVSMKNLEPTLNNLVLKNETCFHEHEGGDLGIILAYLYGYSLNRASKSLPTTEAFKQQVEKTITYVAYIFRHASLSKNVKVHSYTMPYMEVSNRNFYYEITLPIFLSKRIGFNNSQLNIGELVTDFSGMTVLVPPPKAPKGEVTSTISFEVQSFQEGDFDLFADGVTGIAYKYIDFDHLKWSEEDLDCHTVYSANGGVVANCKFILDADTTPSIYRNGLSLNDKPVYIGAIKQGSRYARKLTIIVYAVAISLVICVVFSCISFIGIALVITRCGYLFDDIKDTHQSYSGDV